MRPGSAKVLVCPHCKQWLRCQAIDFSLQQHAEVWSDLRVMDSFWMTPADVVACAGCGELFRKPEAELAGVLPSSIDALDFQVQEGWRLLPRFGKGRELAMLERFLSAPTLLQLDQQQVEAALRATTPSDPEDEIDLRLQLWRFHNDTRRRHAGASWQRTEAAYRTNVARLLGLLATDNEFHNLLAAEIHRQLGQFHPAMQRLSKVQRGFGREKVALMTWILEASIALRQF